MLNSVTSAAISKMLRNRDVQVSGTDLEFLEALYDQRRPMGIAEISRRFKLDKNLAKSKIMELKLKKLVQSNSPRYSVSEDGRKLVKLVREVLPDVEKLVMQDSYLRILAENSRSIVG